MKNKKAIMLKLIFFVGLCVALYPLLSHFYYKYEADQQAQAFDTAVNSISNNELHQRLELAKLYNQTLDPRVMQDPYSEEMKKGIAEYARMLEVKEQLGYIEIPKINEKLPLYTGTSEEVLQKGSGHLEGSSLPIGGDSTHTVLTAHRGLPKALLFTNLDQLVLGDMFYVHTIAGVLAYEIDNIVVVEPSDFSKVLVEEGLDYATLLTCTPYMVNSHRLLVRGHRVPYQEGVDKKQEPQFIIDMMLMSYIIGSVVLFIIIILLRLFFKKKNNKN